MTFKSKHVALTYAFIIKFKGKAVPLQAWSVPEGSRKSRFPDFVTTAQDGGKFASLTHRPPLLPGNAPGTHFSQRLSRPQGHSAIGRILCKWKIPVTPTGIEQVTFQFVAQHLNHCTTAVPHYIVLLTEIHLIQWIYNIFSFLLPLSWFQIYFLSTVLAYRRVCQRTTRDRVSHSRKSIRMLCRCVSKFRI